jgi:hypothetical protein
MKILSHEIKDGMIHVMTDNKDRPDFHYFADKFQSVAELEAEINRSIALEGKHKIKKEAKLKKFKDDLKEKIK